MSEPLARGAILLVGAPTALAPFGKECVSILKALSAEATVQSAVPVPADVDLVVVLVDGNADENAIILPDLKDRAATVAALSADAPLARRAIARVRRRLRQHGAVLGARELVLSPDDFGYLGLESDGLRERLEVLLRALVLDAERLRLRREGWEEPDDRPSQ